MHYQKFSDTLTRVIPGSTPGPSQRGFTDYVHDDYGRLYRVNPSSLLNSGSFFYTYDARGNALKREFQSNSITEAVTYAFDGLDRLVSVSATGIAFTYTYDAPPYQGRLTSIQEPDRVVSFTYDPAGRLATETLRENGVATPLVTSYVHDVDGALWQVTYPSGLRLQYDRDPATGEVVRVSNADSGTRFADQVTHYPQGPVRHLAFGNGLALAQTFDLRYQPKTIASGPLALAYTMSPAGDVAAIADTSFTLSGCARSASRTFGYDFLDRLADSPLWLSYRYDTPGNRTSDSSYGLTASYVYASSLPELLQERKVAGKRTHTYGFDEHGNLVALGLWDAAGARQVAGTCLRHDALDRLVLAGPTSYWTVPGGTAICTQDSYLSSVTARFKYDSRNRRVARQGASGQWTYFVHDAAGNVLSELARTTDPANPWVRVRDYVWMDGRPLAQIEYPGPVAGGEGRPYYLHADHIGLPRAMTNAAGQLVWNALPTPYGEVEEKTIPDPLTGSVVVTNLRLPGQYDERLFQQAGIDMQGPYYNWNRWYLPGVGRYLELDPVALDGGLNGGFTPDWYSYGAGNPLTYTDPTGLNPGAGAAAGAIACGSLCAAAGAAIGAATVWVAACTATNTCPWSRPSCSLPPIDYTPRPTIPTTGGGGGPNQPDVPPRPPGFGCKAAFDICMGWAASRPSYGGRIAAAAACTAEYVACLARGG